MKLTRLTLPTIAGLALAVGGCASLPRATEFKGRALVTLLPDPDSGVVGRAIVSNAAGAVELTGTHAATVVAGNRAPAPVTILSDAEVLRLTGGAFDTLPPASQRLTLNFQFDSDELTADSRALLPQVLNGVKGRPVPEVRIVGHTDTIGSTASNITLGLKRAEMIRTLLIETGLDASLIEVASHGEADLLVPTADETAEPRNRRVDITVR
jgi:outer membrane protein OmpA-like peptidoglycan-associated protein